MISDAGRPDEIRTEDRRWLTSLANGFADDAINSRSRMFFESKNFRPHHQESILFHSVWLPHCVLASCAKAAFAFSRPFRLVRHRIVYSSLTVFEFFADFREALNSVSLTQRINGIQIRFFIQRQDFHDIRHRLQATGIEFQNHQMGERNDPKRAVLCDTHGRLL